MNKVKVYSVGQINSYIKRLFNEDFFLRHIYIQGEVSNCKYHSSGHIYFSLKDSTGTLTCVMFAGQRKSGLQFQMTDGQQVTVEGTINVYERDGRYQLYASRIIQAGAGQLHERFLALKKELEEMGMFDAAYKKPVPCYAFRIGILTAPTGAAIRDIMNITRRRNPYVQLVLYPAIVQGDAAPASIVRGLQALDAAGLDVLIIGRGGGSIEDLWAFNDEQVARAVFHCQTPVISAVGHETDTTISDYVADLRAPTPSAAAELAVFDYRMLMERIADGRVQLSSGMRRVLMRDQGRMENVMLKLKLYSPVNQLRDRRVYLEYCRERLTELMHRQLSLSRQRLVLCAEQLRRLSPAEKLEGGYAYATTAQDKPLVHVRQVHPGEEVILRLMDGVIRARVTQVTGADRLFSEQEGTDNE